jgi:hypothetical protein
MFVKSEGWSHGTRDASSTRQEWCGIARDSAGLLVLQTVLVSVADKDLASSTDTGDCALTETELCAVCAHFLTRKGRIVVPYHCPQTGVPRTWRPRDPDTVRQLCSRLARAGTWEMSVLAVIAATLGAPSDPTPTPEPNGTKPTTPEQDGIPCPTAEYIVGFKAPYAELRVNGRYIAQVWRR